MLRNVALLRLQDNIDTVAGAKRASRRFSEQVATVSSLSCYCDACVVPGPSSSCCEFDTSLLRRPDVQPPYALQRGDKPQQHSLQLQ
jgi:hypothetical protein